MKTLTEINRYRSSGRRRPWRIWFTPSARHRATYADATRSFGSREAALAAALVEFPSGRTLLGEIVSVGSIDDHITTPIVEAS